MSIYHHWIISSTRKWSEPQMKWNDVSVLSEILNQCFVTKCHSGEMKEILLKCNLWKMWNSWLYFFIVTEDETDFTHYIWPTIVWVQTWTKTNKLIWIIVVIWTSYGHGRKENTKAFIFYYPISVDKFLSYETSTFGVSWTWKFITCFWGCLFSFSLKHLRNS